MKKRLILTIGVVVLVVVGWWFGFREQRGASTVPAKAADARPITNSAPPSGPADLSRLSPANYPNGLPPKKDFVDPKVAKIEAIVAGENAKSLDFYGKVIDQKGDPVPGVKVKASVGLIVSFTQSGGEYHYAETDTMGRFSFVGIHGAGVGFTLTKEGYFYDQKMLSSSRPKSHVPDPENPVVMQMWKLKGAESMVHAKVHAYVPCDGTATSYNILTGQQASDGDLIITLTRDPVQITRGRPFDWKAKVEIKREGGLIMIRDPYPNEAPALGYDSGITVEMPAKMEGWDASFVRSYYFKAGKIYGRLTVNIQADFQPPPTSVDVEIYANPSGSRNLEFDPAKTATFPR